MLEPLDPSQAPDSWLGLALLLGGQVGAYSAWKEAPWLAKDSTQVKELGASQVFESCHDLHVKKIEEAMNRWIETKTHPDLTDIVDFLYRLRFHAVAPYLATLEGQFSYPVLPYEEILENYLIKLWRTNAPYLALGFAVPDLVE